MLGPLLFTLYAHDCNPTHRENSTVTFVNNTVIGPMINNDDNSYQGKINSLSIHREPNQKADCWKMETKMKNTHACLHQWSWSSWSRWRVWGFWDSTSKRTSQGHHKSSPWERKLRKDCTSYRHSRRPNSCAKVLPTSTEEQWKAPWRRTLQTVRVHAQPKTNGPCSRLNRPERLPLTKNLWYQRGVQHQKDIKR